MSKLLFATFFALLLFVGLHVSVDAVIGSAEEKSRRETCGCLVKEPSSSEESDSNEDSCAPFVTRPPTTTEASTSAAPTSTDAPSSSSSTDASSSSSSTDAPSSSSSSDAPSSSSSSAAPSSSSSSASPSSSSSVSPSPLPRFHSRCRLKHALVNISLTLTGTLRIEFDLLIQEIEDEILGNPCGCMDEDDKIVKVGKKLKKFLSKHKTFKKAMQYKKIGKWGKWRDLVQVSVSIMNERADDILLLDANDDCKLFQALRNKTCGDVTVTVDKEIMIGKMKNVLKNNGWSKTQKHAKLHLHMRSFLKVHVDVEDCIDDIDIDGMGDVGSLRRLLKVKHQTTRLSKVISGNSDDNCELLKKLKATVNNESIEATQRLSIGELHGVILAKFQIEVDLQIRLQHCSQESSLMLQGSPWVLQLLMDIELEDPDTECGCDDGKWGDVYELRFCSHLCTGDDSCGEVGGGEGTEPTEGPTSSTAPVSTSSDSPSSSSSSDAPSSSSSSSSDAPSSSSSSDAPSSSSSSPAPSSSSSSDAPSSSSSSSPAPSSSTGSTGSTVPPVVCGNRGVVVVKNGCSHGNASIIEYSIQVVFDSWGVIQRTSYSSTKNNIRNVVLDDSLTQAQKINRIVDLATNYSKNNLVVQDRQMQIPFLEGLFHGKIRDFCDCGYE